MKIVFMGTPKAAVQTLERILEDGHEVRAVWTQPDRPAGRGNKLSAPPVKEFARERGLEVFQPVRIKSKESIELFKSHEADLAVVVAYGRILPQAYLEAFPKGCVNVHFSLLPKYRGAAPVNWAIVRGEKSTGITTMKMDSGLDTGEILLQSETEIGDEENSVELLERLSGLGAEILSKTLKNFESIRPVPQNDSDATFAPIMRREDGLIDWQKSAWEINDQVRGFQPFPASYTFYEGKKLTIWKARAWETFETETASPENSASESGRIITAEKKDLFVKCASGTSKESVLQILELQIEGKRRMETLDFLNGINLRAGEKLG